MPQQENYTARQARLVRIMSKVYDSCFLVICRRLTQLIKRRKSRGNSPKYFEQNEKKLYFTDLRMGKSLINHMLISAYHGPFGRVVLSFFVRLSAGVSITHFAGRLPPFKILQISANL